MPNLGPRPPGNRRDSGQAIGLVVMVIAVVASVGVGVATTAARLANEGRAHTAADAAALAGVDHGRAAAERAASANGGRLTWYEQSPSGVDVTVSVEVAVGDESAAARASTAP